MSMEDIRRFFPKGTISDEAMAAEAAEAEEWPANYPRRILGWATPQMLFERYITWPRITEHKGSRAGSEKNARFGFLLPFCTKVGVPA